MPTTANLLFRPEVLHLHLSSFQLPERVKTLEPKLAQWAEMIASGRVDSFKEREMLPRFLSDFFYGTLGYAGPDKVPTAIHIDLHVRSW